MAKNNTGKENTGYYNSGHWNSGNYNSGNYNSGYWNSGNWNSGHWNPGNYNSGNWNSGYWNSGNYNSGNWNSGYWNSGYWNSGSFNRDCPKMRLFEKELDITVEEFYEKYNIYMDLPLNTWVDKDDMTKEEKKEYPVYKELGGYLKTLEYKEACQKWWADNPDDHERFLTLPGFDAEIFKDITGIDVEQTQTVNIGGTEYKVTPELTKVLKDLKEV
mgnify:CR=1 FL=1